MTFDEGKKVFFSHKTGLVFVHSTVFKNRSKNFATSKMELFPTISNGLHVAVLTQSSLQAKLKSDENGHTLKAASDTISCFEDMFFHFFRKCQLLSVSLTFCFILKITKMKTGITVNFIFWGLLTEATINIRSEKCC